jgi:hypothetical protein
MIVKNEADILSRCLDSVADIMDEIIIVDTGSTDETKKVAARYTDQIFDFAWIHDFAAARNFAFSKASCEYIYSADADEVVDAVNRQRLKDLKGSLDGKVELVQMYYVNQLKFGTVYNFDREYRPKLFKRCRAFSWIDPIHETIRLEPVIFDSEIEIIHEPKESHASRDLEVFRRITVETEALAGGWPLSKRLHNLYARELFITGENDDFLKAEAYFEASAANTDFSLDQVKEAACVVARSARLRGETAKFFKFALKDIGSEGCSEMCCELGAYYQAQGDFSEAVVWFYNAAFETASILDIRTSGAIPLLGLAECYEALGMPGEAADYRKLVPPQSP